MPPHKGRFSSSWAGIGEMGGFRFTRFRLECQADSDAGPTRRRVGRLGCRADSDAGSPLTTSTPPSPHHHRASGPVLPPNTNKHCHLRVKKGVSRCVGFSIQPLPTVQAGLTGLFTASMHGHLDVVRRLLENQADANLADKVPAIKRAMRPNLPHTTARRSPPMTHAPSSPGESGGPLPSHGHGRPLPSHGHGRPLPSRGHGRPLPSRGHGGPLPSRGHGALQCGHCQAR
jgi:hypothetical protein